MFEFIGDEQKLPMRMVIKRGIDMCQGLQDLHAVGIVIRRLIQVCKPFAQLICLSIALHARNMASSLAACMSKHCCVTKDHHHQSSQVMFCMRSRYAALPLQK